MIDPRITARFKRDVGFELEPHLLVLATMGSHSHGTYMPPTEPNAIDDVDLMGFVVPPLEYHLGLPRWENWRMQQDELDVVLYSLTKAVGLLLKSNPNITGLLWLQESDYVYRHGLFWPLRTNRRIFSALTAANAFCGYAYGQLKRMEAFDTGRIDEWEALVAEFERKGVDWRSWLEMNGPEFDKKVSQHVHPAGLPTLPDKMRRLRSLQRRYFSGYMGERRKALVRTYQYDVKNAAHLIRLLRMGREFLETGELRVYRTTDAEEIKSIKRGEWTLEQVKQEAEKLFEEVRAAEATSKLPKRPDEAEANRLLIWIHRHMLGWYQDVTTPEVIAGFAKGGGF